MKDLREKTVRGAVSRVCAQAVNFLLRICSLAILARLLEPKDFGLVGMVTAVTGVLYLFRDFGLSAASVQSGEATEEQMAALFWINISVGALLMVALSLCAPLVAGFYHEPRLYWVTIVLAAGFLVNAAGIQHSARLQRQMRFTALSLIDTSSWIVSTAVGIGGAKAGYGYWALVAMTVSQPLTASVAFWAVSRWVPQLPSRRANIGSMMRFGGTMTLHGLISYVALNAEKVLLGRFWGADAIGLYGRAYQLIRIPTDTLNNAVGEVAFSALSRLQDQPVRLKNYFLKGYSLILGLTLPATLAGGLFAEDLVGAVLGAKWKDAAPVFRLLTPTILVFAIGNPLGWLLQATGIVRRGVNMSLVITPILIAGYLLGLPYGPAGVAAAYSAVWSLWLIPLIAWSVHGTVISIKDVFGAISRPFVSSVIAGALALGVCAFCGPSHWVRLLVGGSVLGGAYLGMILYVMDQKSFYVDLLRSFTRRSQVEEPAVVSA